MISTRIKNGSRRKGMLRWLCLSHSFSDLRSTCYCLPRPRHLPRNTPCRRVTWCSCHHGWRTPAHRSTTRSSRPVPPPSAGSAPTACRWPATRPWTTWLWCCATRAGSFSSRRCRPGWKSPPPSTSGSRYYPPPPSFTVGLRTRVSGGGSRRRRWRWHWARLAHRTRRSSSPRPRSSTVALLSTGRSVRQRKVWTSSCRHRCTSRCSSSRGCSGRRTTRDGTWRCPWTSVGRIRRSCYKVLPWPLPSFYCQYTSTSSSTNTRTIMVIIANCVVAVLRLVIARTASNVLRIVDIGDGDCGDPCDRFPQSLDRK